MVQGKVEICRCQSEARSLKVVIIECFSSCRLALHQEKTKIVFLQERYRKPVA